MRALGDTLSLLLAVRRVPLLSPTAHAHLPSAPALALARPLVAALDHESAARDEAPVPAAADPDRPPSEQVPEVEPHTRALKPAAIPRTRLGRLYEYGTLAAGVGAGMVTEAIRRAAGASSTPDTSLAFSGPNVERIVAKLSKMRGAALKMGQMISIQDNKMVPPEIEAIFRRVHDSANYMPQWQLEGVLKQELGAKWADKFAEFDMVPIAAASIGQVHRAVLHSGQTVAVKVQYPGVADSISSDLANLKSILLLGSMLPKGLYLDNSIRVAAIELALECDYKREAASIDRFGELIVSSGLKGVRVPKVFHEVSTARVLATEFVPGLPIDKAALLDQRTRNEIAESLFRLCLLELFRFRFMQTDPNWSNFLYDAKARQLNLIDFGASREFPKQFTDDYLRLLQASSVGDKQGCLEYSRKLGFLTGFESATMNAAHINSLQLLSLPFMANGPAVYDFRNASDITQKVRSEIPVMLRERLTPPPEESYSLHRKLSGCFLLCNKLGAQIRCRDIFQETVRSYKFDS